MGRPHWPAAWNIGYLDTYCTGGQVVVNGVVLVTVENVAVVASHVLELVEVDIATRAAPVELIHLESAACWSVHSHTPVSMCRVVNLCICRLHCAGRVVH